ncbi:MAG: PilZ domain-containing protein [Rhodobacteraceae bacterium]|jgi:hypothetical protein|nr:PilZ domain-containing protein [Paracoccaceae bacterium]
MSIHAAVAERRGHVRHAIDLPVLVEAEFGTLHGRTVNLSFGGARIRLPLPYGLGRHDGLRAIVIEGIGHFDCRAVWASDFEIGVQFRDTRRARRLLGALLPDHEDHPAGTPWQGS